MTPVKQSMLSDSFMRRNSLTLASVPAASSGTREPADAPTAPIVTPSRFRKSRRLTSSVIGPPSVGGSVRYRVTAPVDTVGYRAGPAKSSRAARTSLAALRLCGHDRRETMASSWRGSVRRAVRGVSSAIGERPAIFTGAAAATLVLSVVLPPLVLSVARTPVDYVTVNPWLQRLPEYLASSVPWRQKLEKLPDLALFWFSSDSPLGGAEWGFAV